jgi:hypothetical protein
VVEPPKEPTAKPSARATNPPSGEGATLPKEPDVIPPGSGDYSAVLALATRYRKREISWGELERAILLKKLPPHELGDAYLLTPSPVPPPGTTFDPRMMPSDWQGTWGEVAMAMWLGRLSRDEYRELHRAAHPDCP